MHYYPNLEICLAIIWLFYLVSKTTFNIGVFWGGIMEDSKIFEHRTTVAERRRRKVKILCFRNSHHSFKTTLMMILTFFTMPFDLHRYTFIFFTGWRKSKRWNVYVTNSLIFSLMLRVFVNLLTMGLFAVLFYN